MKEYQKIIEDWKNGILTYTEALEAIDKTVKQDLETIKQTRKKRNKK